MTLSKEELQVSSSQLDTNGMIMRMSLFLMCRGISAIPKMKKLMTSVLSVINRNYNQTHCDVWHGTFICIISTGIIAKLQVYHHTGFVKCFRWYSLLKFCVKSKKIHIAQRLKESFEEPNASFAHALTYAGL